MKKYMKSFFSFSVGTWIRAFISFIATPITSYLLAPEEMGKFAMFSLALGILNVFVFLGTDQAFVRFFNEYEKEKRNKLLWECLYPTLANGVVISVIVLLLGDRVSTTLYGRFYPYINLLLIATIFIAIFQLFNQYTILMEGNGMLYSLINVVNAIANMVSTIIFALILNGSFYALVLGTLVGYIAALLTGIWKNTYYWKPTFVNWKDIKKHLVFGLPLVPTFMVNWIYTSIDKISLRQFSTLEEIGLYSAAFKLVSVINLIQDGFSKFWISTAYKRYEEDKNDVQFFKKAHDMVALVMFLTGFLALGFKDIIFLILAKRYRPSANIAPFLIFMPILYSISETAVVGINFTKKTHWHLVISVACAIVNFIGNTVLVPIYGAKGAAFSTGMSYIVYYIMRMRISEKLYPIGFDKKRPPLVVLILTLVAMRGTISSDILQNVFFSFIGIVLLLIIYKNEFVTLISQFKGTIGFLVKKK